MTYDPARDPLLPAGVTPSDFLDGPPLLRHEWELLRDHAVASLNRRVEAYPRLVEAAGMDAADADADISAWRMIVAEWRWIISGEGTPPQPETIPARRAALELAEQRIEAEMGRGRHSEQLYGQYHAVMAMIWHLGRPAKRAPWMLSVHFCAEFNHQTQRDRGARFCHACDRWRTDPATRACTSTGCGLAMKEAA